jgi:methionyl-tRNA formyltransferase
MLDFTKSAEEIYAQIRAFHPWYKCYFGYNSHFFIPNPYKTVILDNNTNINSPGEIVSKSSKNKSITVVCGDNKLIKMHGVKLYGHINGLITSLYIKLSVKKHRKVY